MLSNPFGELVGPDSRACPVRNASSLHETSPGCNAGINRGEDRRRVPDSLSIDEDEDPPAGILILTPISASSSHLPVIWEDSRE